jgi:hypothetical protein
MDSNALSSPSEVRLSYFFKKSQSLYTDIAGCLNNKKQFDAICMFLEGKNKYLIEWF